VTAIAIDPGTVGGIAVVDAGRLLGWAAWRRTRRRATPYDVAASTMRREVRAPTLPYAIRSAAVHLPPELDLAGVPCAVEGIRQHGRKRGFVTLAESAGVAVAVLDGLVGAPLRPLPADWRPAVGRGLVSRRVPLPARHGRGRRPAASVGSRARRRRGVHGVVGGFKKVSGSGCTVDGAGY